jgi:hypothetical protein
MRILSSGNLSFCRKITFGALLSVFWANESFAAEVDDAKQECVAAADRGQPLRDRGQYLAARREFARCSEEGCPALVREQCAEWLRKAVESTPTVVFAATDGSGKDLSAVRVVADGWPIADRLDGRPVELDPGAHEIRFEAADRDPVVVSVVLRAGDKNRALGAVLPPRLVIVQTRALSSAPPERPTGSNPADGPPRTDRATVALALLASGAASGAAGLYFAILSRSDADQRATLLGKIKDGCFQPYSPDCTALGNVVDVQRRDYVLSNVLYAGGGALVAAAVTTWLLWPQKADRSGAAWAVRPTVGLGSAGLRAEMAFQ